ncbi:hypothetical protein [Geomonas sp.]|uniref:hypothetical protein n=1 Tax=Geomonas sp. TaxID=2651584 RepID=UPI002B490C8C|nr:hypothetical protein [Geomonas sp.]HJV34742.1 hypothetical protein [Geomonas sp.]
MRRAIVFLLATSLLSGCTTISGWWQRGGAPSATTTQAAPAKTAASEEKPAQEKPQEAPREKAHHRSKLPSGGADEALFKSALHALKPTPEMPVSQRGRELLRRLKKEYPASPWTALAAPLFELIRVTDDLAHRNQELKAANDSLSKEVNRLNKNIDQLKNLDLQLEKNR